MCDKVSFRRRGAPRTTISFVFFPRWRGRPRRGSRSRAARLGLVGTRGAREPPLSRRVASLGSPRSDANATRRGGGPARRVSSGPRRAAFRGGKSCGRGRGRGRPPVTYSIRCSDRPRAGNRSPPLLVAVRCSLGWAGLGWASHPCAAGALCRSRLLFFPMLRFHLTETTQMRSSNRCDSPSSLYNQPRRAYTHYRTSHVVLLFLPSLLLLTLVQNFFSSLSRGPGAENSVLEVRPYFIYFFYRKDRGSRSRCESGDYPPHTAPGA